MDERKPLKKLNGCGSPLICLLATVCGFLTCLWMPVYAAEGENEAIELASVAQPPESKSNGPYLVVREEDDSRTLSRTKNPTTHGLTHLAFAGGVEPEEKPDSDGAGPPERAMIEEMRSSLYGFKEAAGNFSDEESGNRPRKRHSETSSEGGDPVVRDRLVAFETQHRNSVSGDALEGQDPEQRLNSDPEQGKSHSDPREEQSLHEFLAAFERCGELEDTTSSESSSVGTTDGEQDELSAQKYVDVSSAGLSQSLPEDTAQAEDRSSFDSAATALHPYVAVLKAVHNIDEWYALPPFSRSRSPFLDHMRLEQPDLLLSEHHRGKHSASKETWTIHRRHWLSRSLASTADCGSKSSDKCEEALGGRGVRRASLPPAFVLRFKFPSEQPDAKAQLAIPASAALSATTGKRVTTSATPRVPKTEMGDEQAKEEPHAVSRARSNSFKTHRFEEKATHSRDPTSETSGPTWDRLKAAMRRKKSNFWIDGDKHQGNKKAKTLSPKVSLPATVELTWGRLRRSHTGKKERPLSNAATQRWRRLQRLLTDEPKIFFRSRSHQKERTAAPTSTSEGLPLELMQPAKSYGGEKHLSREDSNTRPPSAADNPPETFGAVPAPIASSPMDLSSQPSLVSMRTSRRFSFKNMQPDKSKGSGKDLSRKDLNTQPPPAAEHLPASIASSRMDFNVQLSPASTSTTEGVLLKALQAEKTKSSGRDLSKKKFDIRSPSAADNPPETPRAVYASIASSQVDLHVQPSPVPMTQGCLDDAADSVLLTVKVKEHQPSCPSSYPQKSEVFSNQNPSSAIYNIESSQNTLTSLPALYRRFQLLSFRNLLPVRDRMEREHSTNLSLQSSAGQFAPNDAASKASSSAEETADCTIDPCCAKYSFQSTAAEKIPRIRNGAEDEGKSGVSELPPVKENEMQHNTTTAAPKSDRAFKARALQRVRNLGHAVARLTITTRVSRTNPSPAAVTEWTVGDIGIPNLEQADISAVATDVAVQERADGDADDPGRTDTMERDRPPNFSEAARAAKQCEASQNCECLVKILGGQVLFLNCTHEDHQHNVEQLESTRLQSVRGQVRQAVRKYFNWPRFRRLPCNGDLSCRLKSWKSSSSVGVESTDSVQVCFFASPRVDAIDTSRRTPEHNEDRADALVPKDDREECAKPVGPKQGQNSCGSALEGEMQAALSVLQKGADPPVPETEVDPSVSKRKVAPPVEKGEGSKEKSGDARESRSFYV